mmetsp:Transcript_17062/g.40005  ORF Transcript_17062/g.40005 Transcript_17062/m.40005 type:complete len:209 (+) Transcript_17062:220-846(+)
MARYGLSRFAGSRRPDAGAYSHHGTEFLRLGYHQFVEIPALSRASARKRAISGFLSSRILSLSMSILLSPVSCPGSSSSTSSTLTSGAFGGGNSSSEATISCAVSSSTSSGLKKSRYSTSAHMSSVLLFSFFTAFDNPRLWWALSLSASRSFGRLTTWSWMCFHMYTKTARILLAVVAVVTERYAVSAHRTIASQNCGNFIFRTPVRS